MNAVWQSLYVCATNIHRKICTSALSLECVQTACLKKTKSSAVVSRHFPVRFITCITQTLFPFF